VDTSAVKISSVSPDADSARTRTDNRAADFGGDAADGDEEDSAGKIEDRRGAENRRGEKARKEIRQRNGCSGSGGSGRDGGGGRDSGGRDSGGCGRDGGGGETKSRFYYPRELCGEGISLSGDL